VPDGADLPVPARVVAALADGEVGEGGAVEGGPGHSNWWGIPQTHIACRNAELRRHPVFLAYMARHVVAVTVPFGIKPS